MGVNNRNSRDDKPKYNPGSYYNKNNNKINSNESNSNEGNSNKSNNDGCRDYNNTGYECSDILVNYKVKDGKLLRLKLFLKRNNKKVVISSALICGDFFAYPEDSIELLEKLLHKKEICPALKKELLQKAKGLSLIGFTPEDLYSALIIAKGSFLEAQGSPRGHKNKLQERTF